LAKAGKLGDAPRAHETWPINYAPDEGKGAAKWEPAKHLYQKLECGKDGIIPRVAGQVDYENRWTALAVDAVKTVLLARVWAPSVDEKINTATLKVRRNLKLKHTRMHADLYLCEDGTLIVWPEWAERSRNLPDRVTRDNWKLFWPIVRDVVRLYLLEDEARTRDFFKAAAGSGYDAKKGWDANVFNHGVMRSVKDALASLSER
jgi:hypothetical protein